MGADMIIEVVARFGSKTDAERHAAMLAVLPALSTRVLKEYAESGEIDIDEGEEDETAQDDEIRDAIKDRINAYFQEHENREVTTCTLFGIVLEVAGGMSWGDNNDTTDMFLNFLRLPEPLLVAGGFSTPHENFLTTVVTTYLDHPETLPANVRKSLEAWRVALAI